MELFRNSPASRDIFLLPLEKYHTSEGISKAAAKSGGALVRCSMRGATIPFRSDRRPLVPWTRGSHQSSRQQGFLTMTCLRPVGGPCRIEKVHSVLRFGESVR